MRTAPDCAARPRDVRGSARAGRSRSLLAGRVPRLAALACLAAGAATGLAMWAATASAQDPAADLVVHRLSWRPIVFGGKPMVRLTGLVENDGEHALGDIEIVARFRAAPGGDVLRLGTTVSDLPELAPGESSPFTILSGDLGTATVGHVDVTMYAKAARGTRYRALEVEGVVTATLGGGPALFGSLVNRGTVYASATSTNVIVGFWDALGLRETRAATMPILYQPGTTTGQGHPPGVAYPWYLRLPDEPWQRLQFWVVAQRYAEGTWPVPLGILDIGRDDRAGVVGFGGRLLNCGVRSVSEFALVATARVASTGALTFTLTDVVPSREIRPAAIVPVHVAWRGLDPRTATADVSFLPFALDQQPLPPRAMPCRAADPGAVSNWLPWLGRAADPGRRPSAGAGTRTVDLFGAAR